MDARYCFICYVLTRKAVMYTAVMCTQCSISYAVHGGKLTYVPDKGSSWNVHMYKDVWIACRNRVRYQWQS